MNDATTVGADRVGVAPGAGVLGRQHTSLLFVPDVEPATADLLIAAFFADGESAGDDSLIDAVCAAAAAGGNSPGVNGFVLVTWADQLRLVVLGPIEVRTDHPGLPMLSGTGSASWVERRVRVDASTVTVVAGGVAGPATDLRLGCVRAGGFAATFAAKSPAVTRTAVDPTTATDSTVAAPDTTVALTGTSVPPTPPPPTPPPPTPAAAASGATPGVDPTGPIGGDRLAALRAAVHQHDQLVGTGTTDNREPSVADAPGAGAGNADAAAPPPLVDDEITLAPDTPSPDVPQANDADRAPFVSAIRCARGHVNPAHVTVCRMCGELIDESTTPESIRQPPLARLEFGDDTTMPIDRSLVLGRQPDLEAAQAPDRARAVVITGDASVSRTHLRIDVEDWSLTVTDCGARSGTAIVTRPGEEPRVLEPWMPHELPIGARLFLGGPASVAIRPVASSVDRHG